MKKKITNKQKHKEDGVCGGGGGGGVSVCQCRSVWYSLKSVAKLYITSKHSTLSLSTEHIYMVEKAKNKNQPCAVVYVKKSAGDI